MSSWQGFAAGILGLSLLEVTLVNKTATEHASQLITVPAAILVRWLNPGVPLIPNYAQIRQGKNGGTMASGEHGVTSNAYRTPASSTQAS